MTLNLIEIGKVYEIKSLDWPEEFAQEFISRFYHLGLVPGQPIALIKKAPWFGDPLLFDVAGNSIAMTKAEAAYIKVRSL